MPSFYLDGYNLLFSLPEETPLDTFIQALEELLSQTNLKAIAIFDNHSPLATFKPSTKYLPSLHILFSPKGLCADAYILEILQSLDNPRLVTVVTSDTALAKGARLLGAKTMQNQAFLNKLLKAKKKPTKQERTESKKELLRLQKIFEERLGEDV